jgi:hypothetical protein
MRMAGEGSKIDFTAFQKFGRQVTCIRRSGHDSGTARRSGYCKTAFTLCYIDRLTPKLKSPSAIHLWVSCGQVWKRKSC